ncbi:calcineurin B-like protein 4, partial [Tanacetum coccineum]
MGPHINIWNVTSDMIGSALEPVKRETDTRVSCTVDAFKHSETLCAIIMRYMEIGRSSRIDDEVVQDQRQRDDNDLQYERQDQPKEEEVERRRSKRARIEKSFGPDFVSFMVENEPTSYREALVGLLSGCKPLGYKWIFKKKMKADGTIDKYKARLVIKGFRQCEGLDFFDTYLPITRITSIRMVLAIVTLRKLEVHQMDMEMTFLNGDLENVLYMNQPEGFMAPGLESKVCRLVKSLYDSWKAPKQGHQFSPYHIYRSTPHHLAVAAAGRHRTTSRDLWLSLEKAYAPHSTSREYTLKTQLLIIEMHGDETPDAYLNRAQEYADALTAIGEPVKDKDLVMLAVSGLHEEYNGLKTTITSRQIPTTFSELHALLSDHDYMLGKTRAPAPSITSSFAANYAVGSPSMPEARQAQLSELTAQLSALGFQSSNGQPSPVSTTSIPIPTPPPPPPPITRQRLENLRQNPKQRVPYNPSANHATVLPTTIIEPTSFTVANNSPEWRQAMKEEYDALMKNG